MKRLTIILLVAIIGLLLNSAHAALAANYRVKKVKVKELPYETQVIITANEGIKYVLFTLSNPPRIVIDIHNATLQWEKKELVVEKAPIKRVHCSQFKDQPPTVRTVVDLTTPEVKCRIREKKKQIIAHISLFQVERKAAGAEAARKPRQVGERARQKEIKEESERRIGGYYAAGKQLHKEGKYQEAIRELEKTLSLSPEHKGAKKYLVKCQSRMEEEPIEKEEVVVQKLPEEQITPPEVGKEPEVKTPEKKVIYKYKEYLIGPGDVLEIFVWRQDDLTMEVTVDAQGKISFPIVGEIEVEGLTTKEIGQKISQGLSQYIKNPWVKVSVKEYYGYRIYVLGQVKTPGRYEMERGQRLVEGLAQAGSWTEDGVLRSVVVIRGGFEKPQVLLVDVNQILKGDLERNIELQAQDIVYVPRRFIADVNYVLNQILPTLRTIVLTDQAVGILEE